MTNLANFLPYIITTDLEVVPGKSAWELILESGLFAKLILLILVSFSIISWAIMLWKWRQLSRAESDSRYIIGKFRSSRDIQALYKSLPRIKNSPLDIMFREAHSEWEYSVSVEKEMTGQNPAELDEEHFKLIGEAAARAGEDELTRLSGYVSFLATTANASPFLGLLGTVWGIMGSFSAIGERGSASLAVVAPGIAEALIATVAGLAAAIPAVVGYNYFNNRLKVLGVMVDNFKSELVSAYRRENLVNRGRH
ncbi:MAG: Tol-Pal system subunit TolQ [candidate division Zixibacteria bacterium]|nr:Tol-Pal system subunit TolQ [candidate division Zixibacteria bacterium]